ncbi:hypothetical protein B0H12DRAFT_1024847 [Mycena haematopus]|nr:hypothetical protein B0H12DRAFT_1024847 [Mycena haematopus]
MADTAPAPATIEINDAMFCTHFKEVCTDCAFDGREENDAFFGFDPIDREGIEAPPASVTKDGLYQCKKHASTSDFLHSVLYLAVLPIPHLPYPSPRSSPHSLITACNQCYGWKKQITRARAAAKKAGKK